jgi:hypothetical protein
MWKYHLSVLEEINLKFIEDITLKKVSENTYPKATFVFRNSLPEKPGY